MANKILRPRRGLKRVAIEKGLVLKKGEIFFEVPETGVGTGLTKIKLGDGSTAYEDLPYAIDPEDAGINDVSVAAVSFKESEESNTSKLLDSIKDGATVADIVSAVKKLLSLNSANKAEKNHASTGDDYGLGTKNKYGHLKISEEYQDPPDDIEATAASLKSVNDLYQMILDKSIQYVVSLESGEQLMTENDEIIAGEVNLQWQ